MASLTTDEKTLLPMLKDAMSFSAMRPKKDAEHPAEGIERLTWGFEYGEECGLKHKIRFAFHQAGHILGSAFMLLKGTCPACDLLVLEATYGDRLHESREHRLERLGKILGAALADGGKVFAPAFARRRTQELLYEMDRLVSDASFPQKWPALRRLQRIPVVVDSPSVSN